MRSMIAAWNATLGGLKTDVDMLKMVDRNLLRNDMPPVIYRPPGTATIYI